MAFVSTGLVVSCEARPGVGIIGRCRHLMAGVRILRDRDCTKNTSDKCEE